MKRTEIFTYHTDPDPDKEYCDTFPVVITDQGISHPEDISMGLGIGGYYSSTLDIVHSKDQTLARILSLIGDRRVLDVTIPINDGQEQTIDFDNDRLFIRRVN